MALDGKCEPMSRDTPRPYVLGREKIVFNEDFFKIDFVLSFMEKYNYSKDDFNEIVL